ncbi:ribosomal-protein-alanine N-acetyltransferase [Chitinophaga niastensis]|uniref:Ribosomal-protein-alanine N-acetyltransferase n=1 Tax=Chitinophaga niastensis TaxID=536980 RepID=A0A2P8HGI7_CHINA|nr:GNAT family protein [Chitinophaga niastensis]PSL45314.1 ribosomal-protein-alanine N-acetyltransferase [Chitinophaga niastensis]
MTELLATFPVLHTQRLDLIEINEHHQPDLFNLFTDQRVTAFYHVIPLKEVADVQKVVAFLRQRFNDKLGVRWGIALKGQQEIIGTIGFNSFTHGHKGVMVFALMPEYWRKGYITEAMQEVIQYGLSALALKRIEAEVLPGNIASEKVLEKSGFKQEGLLREWMVWNGESYDINMYALLKRDLP